MNSIHVESTMKSTKCCTLSRRDIRFMWPIYQFASILGVSPLYNFETATLERRRKQQIQSIILIIVILVGSVLSFSCRYHYFYEYLKGIQVVIDFGNDFFVTLLAFCSITNAGLRNQQQWQLMNKNLQIVDKMLNNIGHKETSIFTNALAQLLLYISLLLLLAVYNCIIWNQTMDAWLTAASYTMFIACYMYAIASAYLITNFAVVFNFRYGDLNRRLQTNTLSVSFVRECGRISRLLAESVDCFNAIYGCVLLLMTGTTVTQMLNCLNFLVNAARNDHRHQRSIFLVNILTMCFTSLVAVLLMVCCGFVTSESKKTSVLCYKLQEPLQFNSLERQELVQLAQQAKTNVTRITAAGFFEINRSTLLGVLSCSTTYFIVMLQFNGVL